MTPSAPAQGTACGAASSASRRPASALRALASLKLTLVLLAALGVGLIAAYKDEAFRAWPLAAPLLALAVNLLAAVATNAVFRRQGPLLVFHLSLVALLLLIGAGRLTYLKGTLELPSGASFEGQLTSEDAAPFHAGRLSSVRFTNEGFTIDYAPGIRRGPTRNTVSWIDGDGRAHEDVVGDQKPLEIHGYRFYTSHNKGFAPLFSWRPEGGAPQIGAVNLPSYPLNDYRQERAWQLPGTARRLWVMLQFDEIILDPSQASAFQLPRDYVLVVRSGDQRWELRPGDSIHLTEGRLTFDRLGTWMGYNVFYDWTLPWLAAACVVAVVSLGWHFWRKFAAKPWDA